jgi:hypothetical protein
MHELNEDIVRLSDEGVDLREKYDLALLEIKRMSEDLARLRAVVEAAQDMIEQCQCLHAPDEKAEFCAALAALAEKEKPHV